MSNPPERIWIEDEFGEGDEDQWTYGTWDVRNYRGYDVEYIRADTVQALTADNARLAAALEPFASALKGNWSHQPDDTKIICGTNEFDLRLNLTLGDFRCAVAALTGKEPSHE